MSPGAELAPLRPASPAELFRAFNALALQGFGGVLPVAQRVLVEQRRWLSREQFVETLSLGQVLPGPNIVNMALMIGDRFFGLRGALAALGGLMCAPLLIVLLLAALYGQLAAIPAVAGALRGMGAVAAGLVISTAIKVMPTLEGSALGRPLAYGLVALSTLAIGWWRVPLVWVVLGLGGISMAIAAWRIGR
ncbi:MAG: chromate transporter [Rubrivivax sp.]